ncbi:MAG: hypothetical protein IJ960_06815 [Oscillospiraceae bacterium]|nr:hypothetical protein [Oscillospiraceae bacterium]
MKKLIVFIFALVLCLSLFAGCTEADKVSYNVSQEADNFNVTRRLAVINARTDKPIFELIGNFSIATNSASELEIIVEVERGVYKKHFVYLNEWTIYVVEDVSGAYVDKYHYEVNFLPEMIVPVTIVSKD